MDDFEKTIIIEPPPNYISAEAMQAIAEVVHRDAGVYHTADALYDAIGGDWLITRGTYAGTFPKRLRSYLKKEYDIKIEPQLMSEVGNIARNSTVSDDKLYVTFTRDDWRGGTFGRDEDGSCYWGQRRRAKDSIWAAGGFAVHIFKDNPGYGDMIEEPITTDYQEDCDCETCTRYRNGERTRWVQSGDSRPQLPVARAWIHEVQSDLWILFNAYSPDNNFGLVRIARVLSTHYGYSYAEIELTNQGHTDGLVWINDGRGYMVGPADTINGYASTDRSELHAYDMNLYCDWYAECDGCGCDWPRNDLRDGSFCRECEDSGHRCYNCGSYAGDDYWVIGHTLLCDGCFCNRGFVCEHCEEPHWNDDLRYMEDSNRGLCIGCAQDHAYCCDSCGGWYEDPLCQDGPQRTTRVRDESILRCSECITEAA